MFSSISWPSYISTVAILLVIYYSFVFYLCYRKNIIQFLTTGGINGEGREQNRSATDTAAEDQQAEENYVNEVKALIQQSGYSRLSKEELVILLQQMLGSRRFETMRLPGVQKRLNKIIIYECQTNCSMHLDEEDLERVWIGK